MEKLNTPILTIILSDGRSLDMHSGNIELHFGGINPVGYILPFDIFKEAIKRISNDESIWKKQS